MTSDMMAFRKIDESKNMRRFYNLYPVSDTLLDGLYAVMVKYGRIGTSGRSLTKLFPDQKSACRYHALCLAKRISHGYKIQP